MPLPSASLKSLAHSHAHLRPLQSRAIFPFLSLPAELRLQIYSSIFDDRRITILAEESDAVVYYTSWKALHIRLVCRQFHEEITEFIFERSKVKILTNSIARLEKRLKGITLLEANWRRIRSFHLHIGIQKDMKVAESDLADLERFLKKYFPPGEEGKVKLRRLFLRVLNCWSDPREFFCPAGVGLTGEHPLLRWVDGIEGLRNAGWRYDEGKYGCTFAVN